MKTITDETNQNSLKISSERLLEFTKLYERKTGKKLTESEALMHAETLLRTMTILYHPISKKDYYSALAKKMFIKSQSKKIISNKKQ